MKTETRTQLRTLNVHTMNALVKAFNKTGGMADSEILAKAFEFYPMDKIFSMARWNDNKASQLFVELEFGVKLPKAQKDRVPMLEKIAKENKIEIDFSKF